MTDFDKMEDAVDELLDKLKPLSEAWDRRLVGFVKRAQTDADDKSADGEMFNALNMLQTHAVAWVASDLRALVHSIGMYQQARLAATERAVNYQIARLSKDTNVEILEVEVTEDLLAQSGPILDKIREALELDPCENPKCPVHGPGIRKDTKDNN